MTNSKFIIVEHHAIKAHLHWDLRFIMPDSDLWMSFAVRKGVPIEAGKKVLAVRTHDHSEEEALFLGKLESGYGAGVLRKWDDGPCVIHKFSPSHILIEFKGKRVRGFYHLISTGVIRKQEYKAKQYILFKGKTLNEIMGMVSRIPSRGESDDTETGSNYEESDILHWSINKE